jgi:hypothetical protein
MQKLITLLTLVLLAVNVGTAQSDVEEVDFLQSIIGAEKKAVVADFIDISPAAKDAFWSLYDQYETERKAVGKDRIALLKEYAEKYDGITPEQTDELLAKAQKIRDSNTKLIDSYHKKIKKVAGSKAAAQFYQLESYFQAAIQVELFSNIPLIGELDN